MAYTSRVENLKSEKLRKVNDAVYQEANPTPNQRRPFEWRRDFNFVWLPLTDIEIISNFHVQDKEFSTFTEYDKSSLRQITPDVKTHQFIKAVVDKEKFEDAILCAVTDDRDKEITRLEQSPGATEVYIKRGVPTEGSEQVPSGIYGGRCSRITYDKDYLCFDLTIPEKQLNNVLEYLTRDLSFGLEVGVYLLSFDYEVDAALREPYHQKYLFIEETADALLGFVKTSSHVGSKTGAANENINDRYAQHSPSDVASITRALGRLTLAVWVLIALIGYLLLR